MGKRVLESFGLALEADSRIDLEAGIIHGVKILGSRSRNNRIYPPKLLAERFGVYEGAQCYADHAYDQVKTGRPRSMNEMGGVLRRVCYRGESVYGDLDCLLDTEAGRIIMGAARKCPDRFGLSPFHLIEAEKQKDGTEVVTAIIECLSVDAVTRPATTKTLFEAEEQAMPDDPAAAPAPAAPPATSIEDAFIILQNAVMADTGLEDSERIQILKDCMKLKSKVLGGGEEEAPAEGEAPAEESHTMPVLGKTARRLDAIEQGQRAIHIRLMAGEELRGLLDAGNMQALLALADDAAVVTYLDNLRRQRRPRYSSGPARSQGRAVVESAPVPKVPRLSQGADKELVRKWYRS